MRIGVDLRRHQDRSDRPRGRRTRAPAAALPDARGRGLRGDRRGDCNAHRAGRSRGGGRRRARGRRNAGGAIAPGTGPAAQLQHHVPQRHAAARRSGRAGSAARSESPTTPTASRCPRRSTGRGAGADVVFGVIIGTGTGGGIVVGGKVLTGPNAIAGEWGHNPLPSPGTDELPGPSVLLRSARLHRGRTCREPGWRATTPSTTAASSARPRSRTRPSSGDAHAIRDSRPLRGSHGPARSRR